MKKKKNNSRFLYYLGKSLLFLIKITYYLVKGITILSRKAKENIEKNKIKKKRESVRAKYVRFKIVEKIEGDYKKWLDKTYKSDSQIGIILGARGSGKTAFGIKFLENFYVKYKKKCFAIGFNANEFPSWIKVISDISKLENNCKEIYIPTVIVYFYMSSNSGSMKSCKNILFAIVLIAITLPVTAQTESSQKSSPLSIAPPESVGISPERLNRIDAMCKESVKDGDLPGIVALVARNGKIVLHSPG